MYCLTEDDDLLKSLILLRIKTAMTKKKEFGSEPVYNEEFLKIKVKSHGNKVADF